MSLIIKGMDMPQSCRKCKFCVDLNDYPFKMCFLTETELPLDADNLDNCPLIEIVTCKECKYAEYCEKAIHRHGITFNPIDFCSYGERRKDESIY